MSLYQKEIEKLPRGTYLGSLPNVLPENNYNENFHTRSHNGVKFLVCLYVIHHGYIRTTTSGDQCDDH